MYARVWLPEKDGQWIAVRYFEFQCDRILKEGRGISDSYHLTDTHEPNECLRFKFIIPFLNEYEFINKDSIHLSYLVSCHEDMTHQISQYSKQ